jgi:outer membrane protein OmpA-like peptidoglycan-associated protein
MGTTSKIIYGSVLTLLIIMMFLIFYMQKSAQLTLDMKETQQTIAKKNLQIADIQKTLDATNNVAESAQSKNKLIPELTENLATIEKEKTVFIQQLSDLKGNLSKQSALASDRLNELTQLQKANEEQQQLLAKTESQFNEATESLNALQEELIQANADIEEKERAISFYTEKLEANEQAISLAKSKSTSKAMNLTLILDELAAKTMRANQLEDKIEQLAGTAGLNAIIPANASSKDVNAISELQSLFEKMQKETAPPANTELPKAYAQIEELNIANATLLSNINAQSARIQVLQDELQKKEESLAAEKEILYVQQMDNKALISELETTVKDGIDATIPLKEQITSLEIKLAEAMNDNTSLTEKLTASEEKLTELKTANDSLNNELVPAQTALAAALAQVTELTGGMETATASLQQKEDVYLSLTTELEEVKGGLAEAQEKYEALNVQYTALEAELTERKAKDEQQVEQVTSMQGLLDQQTSATEQSMSDLSAKLTAAENETGSLKTELEKITATVAEKELTIQELTAQIAGSSEQLTNLQASLDQAKAMNNSNTEGGAEQKQKIAALMAQIAAAKTLTDQQATTQTAVVAEKETTIQNLTTQLSDNSAKLAEEASVAKALADEAAAAKTLADEQAALLASTKEQLAALEEKQQGMEATLSESETQLSKSKDEITALQEQIAALTAERDKTKLTNTDTDKDGVSDADDTCPETLEGVMVNAQGCEEDSDNDGLVNRLDLCSDTAEGATVDKAGCSAEQTTVVLEGITFTLGTAKLTPEASSILDIAANILQNNPDISMEVAGHTDSIGEKESNLRLSALRAQSVTSYLVSKGVSADRLQSKGYGAEEPIADNTTKEGRAKNRRVELRRVTVQ